MPLISPSFTAKAVAACLGLLLVPSFAFAGTAQLDDPAEGGPHFTFTAASGETNRLFIFLAPGGYRVVDLGAAITAGPGCSAVSSSEVFCEFTLDFEGDLPTIDILLGDLNDFASVGETISQGATIAGEDGSDELETSDECCDHVLLGGPGSDTLRSLSGSTRMDGGDGGDVIEASGTVDYSTRVNSVFVDPDGVADDGELGEGDNVVRGDGGFLRVLGGSGADSFTGISAQGGDGDDTFTAGDAAFFDGSGEAGDDVFFGGSSFDFFDGGPGRDELNGGGGGDDLFGGSGADTIRGDAGRDFVLGDAGNDLLIGGEGRDFFAAGRGADEIRARDGVRDRVRGDTGFDRARVDRGLDSTISIEAFF